MASPTFEAFLVCDDLTGLPLTGKAIGAGADQIHFTSYVNSSGVAIVPQPTITELGGGWYVFTPVFPTDKGISYTISTGGESPLYLGNYIRPEEVVTTSFTVMGTLSSSINSMITWIFNLFHGF